MRSEAQSVLGAARLLLDEACRCGGVPFAALVLVAEDGTRAHGLLGREDGRDVAWIAGFELDLRSEPSGVASAVFEAAPFSVYDATRSGRVSPRAVEAARAKSVAYVPVIAEGRVVAVLVVAETRRHRSFSSGELAALSELAATAASTFA